MTVTTLDNIIAQSKLTSLGPWALVKAKLILAYKPDNMFRVDFRNKLQEYESFVPRLGVCGPIFEITGELKRWAATKHPLATHAAYCHGIPEMLTHVPDHLKLNMQKAIKALDPEFSFLVFGGFVFFSDEEDKTKMHGAAAMMRADKGITMGEKQNWIGSFTQELQKAGRFQPVHDLSLVSTGAKYMCFVAPEEDLFAPFPWTPCPHGAWVFLFDAKYEYNPYDCYFPVIDSAPSPSATQLVAFSFAPTPKKTPVKPVLPTSLPTLELSCTACGWSVPVAVTNDCTHCESCGHCYYS